MSCIYKCTACEAKATFESRTAALAAGWILVEILTASRVKYHVLCPVHAAVDWVRVALGEALKGKK